FLIFRVGLIKPIWVAPQEKALVPVFRQNTVRKTGIFCLHENQSAESKQKFSSTFWKRWWVSKGQSPLTHSAECGALSVQAHFRKFETLLQVKRVSRANCNHRLSSKIIQWMIFDSRNLLLTKSTCIRRQGTAAPNR